MLSITYLTVECDDLYQKTVQKFLRSSNKSNAGLKSGPALAGVVGPSEPPLRRITS